MEFVLFKNSSRFLSLNLKARNNMPTNTGWRKKNWNTCVTVAGPTWDTGMCIDLVAIFFMDFMR